MLSGGLSGGLPGCQEACQEGCQVVRRPVGQAARLSGCLSGGLLGCPEACQEACQEVRRPVRKPKRPDPRDIRPVQRLQQSGTQRKSAENQPQPRSDQRSELSTLVAPGAACSRSSSSEATVLAR